VIEKMAPARVRQRTMSHIEICSCLCVKASASGINTTTTSERPDRLDAPRPHRLTERE
jgi:hypothetical protein